MYDFDSGVERKGTNCIKWDVPFVKEKEDVLPMWIADMDFRVAPAIPDREHLVINFFQKIIINQL